MSGLTHPLALVLTRAATRLMPPGQRDWGRAMQCELTAISSGRHALEFALGCLRHATMARIAHAPVWLGVACAATATGLGLAVMAWAGAPRSYLAINAAALVIGLLALANLNLVTRIARVPCDRVALGIAILLVALGPFGITAQGATRWLSVGGAVIQPSLILVPLLLVLAARRPSAVAATALAIAALVLAWQPDRAMAGALAFAAIGLWRSGGARQWAWAVLIAVGSLVFTLASPDLGERMPYVDQILWLAFTLHPLAGGALWCGALLLLVPTLVVSRLRPDLRAELSVLGLFWGGAIVAAALGNYPTPVVGFGSSAVIGYCLSLLGLVNPAYGRLGQTSSGEAAEDEAVRADRGNRAEFSSTQAICPGVAG